MTNGDKIRSMTDEELVNLFVDRYGLFACPSDGQCLNESDCDKCFKRWLRKKAEK